MSIVLKENDWAENMIQSKSLGKKPSETLRRIARYYIDNGYDKKKEVRQRLDIFLLQCDPLASLPKWDAALEYAVSSAFKYEAVDIDHIDIYENELKLIESLGGVQIERLAFTLLCLRFLYKGIIINHNKKPSQPTLKRRFFQEKGGVFSWPGFGKEWC